MVMAKSRISDLAGSEQPLEKLVLKGASNLSDAELIAILLHTGTKVKNVIQLAEHLVHKNCLNKLSTHSIADLTKTAGIGLVKAGRILAAVELGQRLFAPLHLQKIRITSTNQAIDQLREFANRRQEHLVALYLNARSELIKKEILSVGNLNTNLIEPKEVFSPALTSPCAGIILAHNHPSGDPQPSQDDLIFTKQIYQAGIILGVALIDHLIICQSDYFSFRQSTDLL